MRKMFIFVAATILSVAVHAQTPAVIYQDQQTISDQLGERELLERELAYELAPIKSEDDLEKALRDGIDGTPLAALSPGAQERFLSSLVFTENGIGSFYYEDLRAELGPADIYRILSMFGVQRSTSSIPGLVISSEADELIITPQADGGDHIGYLCLDRATCMESRSFICTSNC